MVGSNHGQQWHSMDIQFGSVALIKYVAYVLNVVSYTLPNMQRITKRSPLGLRDKPVFANNRLSRLGAFRAADLRQLSAKYRCARLQSCVCCARSGIFENFERTVGIRYCIPLYVAFFLASYFADGMECESIFNSIVLVIVRGTHTSI